MNKKILNATPQEYSGVKFRSKIEAMVYKVLKENGFDPRYEEHTYTLWEGYRPTVPFYTKSSPRNRGSSGWNKLNLGKLRDITYTPDFYMEHRGLKIIIEVKGNVNDVFPYKFKMLRKYIESLPDKGDYIIFEIFSKKQLLEATEIIKTHVSSRENEEVILQPS